MPSLKTIRLPGGALLNARRLGPMPNASTLADALAALFAGAGFARADTAILQPASLFVDLSGEDIRRRLYLTTDAEGVEWCLRPEFTIPLAREYVLSARGAGRRDVAYVGPVFRLRPGKSGEFPQAGVESFGRGDREAADAETLGLALDACARAGLTEPAVIVGDAGLRRPARCTRPYQRRDAPPEERLRNGTTR